MLSPIPSRDRQNAENGRIIYPTLSANGNCNNCNNSQTTNQSESLPTIPTVEIHELIVKQSSNHVNYAPVRHKRTSYQNDDERTPLINGKYSSNPHVPSYTQ